MEPLVMGSVEVYYKCLLLFWDYQAAQYVFMVKAEWKRDPSAYTQFKPLLASADTPLARASDKFKDKENVKVLLLWK